MQWAILPVVAIFLVLCLRALIHAWRDGRIGPRTMLDARLSAFVVSATLTLLGFGLGAAIRGSTTMVPAHYHASVGAVTVAFMAAAPGLLRVLGRYDSSRRLDRLAGLQPVLYGAGMALFAAGFALAGANGMGRKVFGAEQAARTLAESAGLVVMGVGGFVAAVGGVLFLGVVVVAWRRSASSGQRPVVSLATGLEVMR
jgi:heme/copper-type cytochrome/quinol oxidase subunit 1